MSGKKVRDERFKLFGTVAFTATTKVNDFIEHLKNNKVVGTRCNVCGEHFFPPRADCHRCFSTEMSWFDISSLVGNLVSYSELKFAPRGFEGDLPYSIALLDFGKCKMFGRLDASIDLYDVIIGMEMKVVVIKLKNGQLSYVFKKL